LEILAKNHLDDGFDASPAIVGRQIFLRGRQSLYCISERWCGSFAGDRSQVFGRVWLLTLPRRSGQTCRSPTAWKVSGSGLRTVV